MARIYWRVRKPRTLGVRAIVLDRDDRLVLVRHTYTRGWYLPGGGLGRGESFATALIRELREELALEDAAVEGILGVYHSRIEGKDDHIAVFVARIGPQSAAASADPVEIEEVGLFGLDELPPDLSPATARRIAEFRAGGPGFGPW